MTETFRMHGHQPEYDRRLAELCGIKAAALSRGAIVQEAVALETQARMNFETWVAKHADVRPIE